ncbi:MAG: efflux RND transporter periplasmic adaptor subunit [Burkholderiales bacterium]
MKIPILIPALFGAAVMLSACGDKPAEKPALARDPLAIEVSAELLTRLTLGSPELGQVRETLRVPGRIEADETRLARVGSPVSGRITDLAAAVGQEVKRGQILATINSTELSTAQLAYLKALSQRGLAARAATRAQLLLDADVIGSAELQRRQAELVQTEAEANASRDQLKVLGMSETAIEKLSSSGTITSRTQIVSSISGTVIERKVTEGQVVQPADGVFLIADLSRVWVVADVPEQNASAVRIGESVQADIPGLDNQRLQGTISFVSPTVNPETRTIRARMEIANPARDFKPAMLAAVLMRGALQSSLVIPTAAIVREDNRDYVFVQSGSATFQLREVKLGIEYEGRRVVQDGLRSSDAIVVDGAFHLNNERKRRALQ